MPIVHEIRCDREGCDSSQMYGLHAAPTKWIMVSKISTSDIVLSDFGEPDDWEAYFCSWTCLMMFVDGEIENGRV